MSQGTGYPQTRAELINRGYVPSDGRNGSNLGTCRTCQAQMEWWVTPKGKNIPMDVMQYDDSPAVAHWQTCPSASQHRAPQAQQQPATRQQQPIGTFKPGARPAPQPSNPYPPTGAEISDDEIPF